MVYQIGEHRYSPRTKATYASKEASQFIFNAYFRKYAPSGYFNPDGSYCLYDEDGNKAIRDEEGNLPMDVTLMKLDEATSERISARIGRDPNYIEEMLDFYCLPVGRSPLLSIYLEDYKLTKEEEGYIESMRNFSPANGTESVPKKQESTENTDSLAVEAVETDTTQQP